MAKIFQVLKSETQNDVFIQKLPVTKEDFNTGSVLIVHESQEAIFLLNARLLMCILRGSIDLQQITFRLSATF